MLPRLKLVLTNRRVLADYTKAFHSGPAKLATDFIEALLSDGMSSYQALWIIPPSRQENMMVSRECKTQ